MDKRCQSRQSRSCQGAIGPIIWLLRITLALQAIGISAQYLLTDFETESPLFGYLLYDRRWSQVAAQRVDDLIFWLWTIVGLAVFFVPLITRLLAAKKTNSSAANKAARIERALLAVLFVVQVVLVWATWHRGEGEVFNTLVPLEQIARWMTPALLLLLLPAATGTIPERRSESAMWLLRLTVAITFATHGYKAIQGHGVFVDYLLSAANSMLGWDATESTMKIVLAVIGWVDIAVAILVMTRRWRSVALYMMLWALIGAVARVIHSGPASFFEIAIRSGNYCLPLAVALYFHYSRGVSVSSSAAKSPPHDDATPS